MHSKERLKKIFNKTDGSCHICGKKLYFSNYGDLGGRGNWEVEHSKPKEKGGTNHLNNLLPSCISCNRAKGKASTRSARAKHDRTRAPYSSEKKAAIQKKNTIGGGLLAIGLTVLATTNPIGLTIAGVTGGLIGSCIDPDQQ